MIECGNLSFRYSEAKSPALKNLSFRIAKGEFVLLCGSSGCGKTTLLRILKPSMQPIGEVSGMLLFEGRPINELSVREQTARIGYVAQSPDTQLVTDKVWHELAFAMESLGYETKAIRSRTAEMAEFFGISGWYYKNVSELSGGQKQLLNLASVMTLCPDILVLDEPTSQLDPVAAGEFLKMLDKINRELGTAVLLSEHRLEEAIPLADRLMVMEEGKIVEDGKPSEIGRELYRDKSSMFMAMTSAMRVWAELTKEPEEECPLTVREGRNWLEKQIALRSLSINQEATAACIKEVAGFDQGKEKNANEQRSSDTVLEMQEAAFRYQKEGPDVVRNLSLSVYKGELAVILGGNGAGKSTAMKLMAGIYEPVHGTVECRVKKAMLPQDPKTMFAQKTVRKELEEMEVSQQEIAEMLRRMQLEHLQGQHPFDISGGEQQRLGLAKLLLKKPELLLLDEPTKGLDAQKKEQFALLLRELCKEGKTVVMISHDVEFAASYADRCLMFFDGAVTAEDAPRDFFSNNSFYTTAISRMSRGILDRCVTLEDVKTAFGKDTAVKSGPAANTDDSTGGIHTADNKAENKAVNKENSGSKAKKSKTVRKLITILSGIGVLYFAARLISGTDLTSLISGNRISDAALQSGPLYVGLFLSFAVLILTLEKKKTGKIQKPEEQRKADGTQTTVNHLGKGKPGARELALVASMTAFAIAGRAAFFAIPGFTPIFGIVILSGAALEARNGFLVGALSMLLSNFLFGQGPWTPWQMAAMGILGVLGHFLFQNACLPEAKLYVSALSALITTVIYGGIMNLAAAVIAGASGSISQILAYYIAGLPVDLVHGAATFIFMWFLAEPVLSELNRVIRKYRL